MLYANSMLEVTCAYRGVRDVSFSENFAYVLNECSPSKFFILLEPKSGNRYFEDLTHFRPLFHFYTP